jgi:hypothetical protein
MAEDDENTSNNAIGVTKIAASSIHEWRAKDARAAKRRPTTNVTDRGLNNRSQAQITRRECQSTLFRYRMILGFNPSTQL